MNDTRRTFISRSAAGLAALTIAARGNEAGADAPKVVPATGWVHDPLYAEHDTGRGHPESPARYHAVMKALSAPVFAERLARIEPRDAAEAELLLVHAAEYLKSVDRDFAEGRSRLSTGDTVISPRSKDAALRAAGGVLKAVDAVFAGTFKNAFCSVRPPGHHATPTRGMGFCIYNNVALAARYAQKKHGVGKVLIVDWDVHHGNGTQDAFYEDDSVFFFSSHQWPLYPGTGRATETGAGKGLGATMNRTFPAGAARKVIVGAFEDDLLPAIQKFKPELVLLSAGFDSRVDDPLGEFKLTDPDFEELTRLMMGVAKEHANGRLVSVLEGGYNLAGLASAVASHVGELSRK